MLNAVKKVNAHQNRILVVEFAEVKFEPAVLSSKTSLKPAAITRHHDFVRESKILRGGSEGLRLFGPLVQSFRPRPPRLQNSWPVNRHASLSLLFPRSRITQ